MDILFIKVVGALLGPKGRGTAPQTSIPQHARHAEKVDAEGKNEVQSGGRTAHQAVTRDNRSPLKTCQKNASTPEAQYICLRREAPVDDDGESYKGLKSLLALPWQVKHNKEEGWGVKV